MSISRLVNRPCLLLLREDGEDAYGNPVKTTSPYEAVCELQRKRGNEPDDAGETSDTRWLVVLLPTAEDDLPRRLDTRDAVEVDGDVYQFVVDPERLRDPWRRTFSHIEVDARRVATAGEGS